MTGAHDNVKSPKLWIVRPHHVSGPILFHLKLYVSCRYGATHAKPRKASMKRPRLTMHIAGIACDGPQVPIIIGSTSRFGKQP